MASPERLDAARANAGALASGAWRLLAVVLVGAAALWAVAAGRLTGALSVAAVLAAATTDLWSIDRRFYEYSPRASTLFADDAVTTRLRAVSPPYRVADPTSVYGYAILMAYRIPNATGYHGFALRTYDELGGLSAGWRNVYTPNLLDMLAIRFLILPSPQVVPGYHLVVGSTPTAFGSHAVLYERDTIPAYARVVRSAVKLADGDVVPTVLDRRFPVSTVVVLPDTSTADVAAAVAPFPASAVRARVAEWAPGRMRIVLDGRDDAPGHLLIAENWYPDWRASVDGRPAAVRRVNHTLLGVDLPAGARDVAITFDSPAYARGKLVSLVALIVAVAMTTAPFVPALRRRARRV
jgi:hypothetical protein